MDSETVKRMKRDLEESILQSINKFNNITQCYITDMDLSTNKVFDSDGNISGVHYKVEIKVEL